MLSDLGKKSRPIARWKRQPKLRMEEINIVVIIFIWRIPHVAQQSREIEGTIDACRASVRGVGEEDTDLSSGSHAYSATAMARSTPTSRRRKGTHSGAIHGGGRSTRAYLMGCTTPSPIIKSCCRPSRPG